VIAEESSRLCCREKHCGPATSAPASRISESGRRRGFGATYTHGYLTETGGDPVLFPTFYNKGTNWMGNLIGPAIFSDCAFHIRPENWRQFFAVDFDNRPEWFTANSHRGRRRGGAGIRTKVLL
jgi:hypothetical protein